MRLIILFLFMSGCATVEVTDECVEVHSISGYKKMCKAYFRENKNED